MSVQTQARRRPVKRPLTLAVLFSYVLVGLMLACLAYALNHILSRIFPKWEGWFIPLLAFLVAIQAAVTYRQLRQSITSFGEWALWRLTEWVVLAIVLKLALYLLLNPADFLADVPRWQEAFLAAFFTDAYLITLGIAVIVWIAANTFAEVLYGLEENTEEWDLERQGVAVKNREAIRRDLIAHVFGYGTLLLAVTAFLNLEIAFLPERVRGLSINIFMFVLYFVFGLILLAQSQFSVLRARWYLQDIPSSPLILSRWLGYSILLVLGIALVVFLLPTQYAVGILALLQIGLSVVMYIALILQFLILTPLLLLFSWLARLLGVQNLDIAPEPVPPQPPPPLPTAGTQPWLEVLRSILFWLLFLTAILFSFRYYLRQHGDLLASLTQAAPLRWLRGLWNWLLGFAGSAGQTVQQVILSGVNRIRTAGVRTLTSIPGKKSVTSRLPPRQQVLLTYLTMLIWLKQNGVERNPSSTPHEFARQLAAALPEAHPDIEGITRLFIEARYSKHPVSGEQGSEARARWERIRQQYLHLHEQQNGIRPKKA